MALLDDVKNYLDITWSDDAGELKLLGIIDRGKKYLNSLVGAELNFDDEGKAKELLLDYCRYVRSDTLNEFQPNYRHELLSLQLTQEVTEDDE